MIDTKGKIIISTFVFVIVGIVLLQAISDDVKEVTTATLTSGNETVTLTSDEGTTAHIEGIAATACRNQSADQTVFVLDLNCNVSSVGAVIVSGLNFSDQVGIDYTFQPEEYVRSATSATLIALVVLFFALAILAISMGFIKDGFNL